MVWLNYQGSSRRLFGNSKAAMVGAIEIYNKPRFEYRDEVFVILLMNAWELLLKAIVSKSGSRIYYPKKRGEPYRTLTCQDAFKVAANSSLWPRSIPSQAVDANIEILGTYRNSAVHFYNERAFSGLIYSLAQTAILSYRDLASHVFGKDIADEITCRIMPLGIENPIDPVEFMKGSPESSPKSRAVQDFLAYLKERADTLESDGIDTERLLTVFDVSLQSVKKIDRSDIVVGVTSEDLADSVVVSRKVDPNVSHPYRQKDVLPKLKRSTTSYEWQAVTFVHEMREEPRYCWRDKDANLVKWSPEAIQYFNRLTEAQIGKAKEEYSASFRK
ncbi:DUF3644 domain-containing protein [Streptomyces litchfieldiae]|uniref:DUF3644 domain-containing protein n=1 Tax=Streptomyces litchfieldiae TaxID=3075543 RepID=A0ABU2MJX3_9ACTN|nr:DUF3644 domain-containing protein [Streptomyces sp. DSM 44938]MDT0341906.1 DUF3644 domain-containing protein [Streptomyces sp. DSM 44938]